MHSKDRGKQRGEREGGREGGREEGREGGREGGGKVIDVGGIRRKGVEERMEVEMAGSCDGRSEWCRGGEQIHNTNLT